MPRTPTNKDQRMREVEVANGIFQAVFGEDKKIFRNNFHLKAHEGKVYKVTIKEQKPKDDANS